MFQQYLLDYFQKMTIRSFFHYKTKITATRGAQLVGIGIPTIFLYNYEPNLISILPKR